MGQFWLKSIFKKQKKVCKNKQFSKVKEIYFEQTADSDTVSTSQVSAVQLVTDSDRASQSTDRSSTTVDLVIV